jgi:sortase A
MTTTQTPRQGSATVPDEPEVAVPRWARAMGLVGRVLITAGVILALFAAFQIWGTGIHEARAQADLRQDFESRLERARTRTDDLVAAVEASSGPTSTVESSPVGPSAEESDAPELVDEPDEQTVPTEGADPGPAASGADETGSPDPDPEILTLLFPEDGDAVARIEIPSIGVDKVVVRGIDVEDLRKGPGLYPSTTLPGNQGNAAIAGHRTTYGAPFGQIDELRPGDDITVTTTQGRFTYRVADATSAFGDRADDVSEFGDGHVVVAPTDTWVLDDFGDNRLTLTACHPKYSARERIIVAATLVSEPVGLPEAVADLVGSVGRRGIPGEVFVRSLERTDHDVSNPPAQSPTQVTGTIDFSSIGRSDDLDQGLGGDRGAIPVAIGWLVVALGTWLVGLRLARRRSGWRRRVAPYLATLLPAAVALWMCFEAADRALPAF